MLSRDHYAVLGVAPDADHETIEAAFRRLSRRYHPDLNPGDPQAQAAFERLKLAHSVLTDREERARYDREGRPAADEIEVLGPAAGQADLPTTSYGELFRQLRDQVRRARPPRGADVHVTVTCRLVDCERGRRTTTELHRQVPCPSCSGSGRRPVARAMPCSLCSGSGKEVFGRGALTVAVACADCRGEGLLRSVACDDCHGSGLRGRNETVAVQIPPGVRDGQKIRVVGGGHHGARGGPPGDLVVTVVVQDDPRFERQGPHVTTTVPVSVSEAVLGARVEVPTPEGDVALLRVPPGSRGGTRLRLRGRGLEMADGRRGDLFAVLELWLPEITDEDARRLISEFGERSGTPPRPAGRRATVPS